MAKIEEMLINSILPHDSVSMNLKNTSWQLWQVVIYPLSILFSRGNEVTKWAPLVSFCLPNSPSYTGSCFLTHVKVPTCHQLQRETQ